MKLSDLWPGHKPPARTPARPSVSVTVTKRAGAEQPIVSSSTLAPSITHRAPTELPAALAECEALEEILCRDAIRLECQIGQAKGRAVAEGKYSNPDWYHRAKAALKHINRDRARLLYRCGQLRKEAKTHAQQHMDRVILDVIKESLPADQFMGFVRIAEARAAQGVAR